MKYVLLFAAVVFSANLEAAPRFKAQADDAAVTLHDEKCQLSSVGNLPHKATWEEKGKKFEGCWGLHGNVVLAYFEDKTVVAIPADMFVKITGA